MVTTREGTLPLHSAHYITQLAVSNPQLDSYSPYDAGEPEYEDDLEPEPYDGQEPDDAKTPGAESSGEHHMLTADPDARTQAGETVVNIGDPAASRGQKAGFDTVKGIKEKKIADDKRTTTPYMTKYERARVLGTRALQIR